MRRRRRIDDRTSREARDDVILGLIGFGLLCLAFLVFQDETFGLIRSFLNATVGKGATAN